MSNVRGSRRGEQPTVPDAQFDSYYGRPVLNQPVWHSADIAGYLFLGGLAGASAVLGAGAHVTDRPTLAKTAKIGSFGAVSLSLGALVHDLGRPARFLNMLRVLKVTSPMSVGSWLLAGFAPLTAVAAGSAATGKVPRVGAAATVGAAVLGPAVASYTAVLISDTAVPAWHDGYPEMPFVFAGSAAVAAGGFALATAPTAETAPARNLALLGAATELAAVKRMERRLGMVAEPYRTGKSGRLMRASEALTGLGVLGAVLGRRSRTVSAVSGAALLAASATTRLGVFHAGVASAQNPKYTVVPQCERTSAPAP